MKLRIVTVLGAILVIFGSLFFKLYDIQVRKGIFYSARAESQFLLAGLLEPKRGRIFFTDKNGNLTPAALNKEYPVVFAVPKEIVDLDPTTDALSKIFGIAKSDLVKKLSKSNDTYELIALKAKDEEVAKVKEARLTGIYINSKEFRFYPFGSLASHILGFVGLSGNDDVSRGRYGLEAYYDHNLHGSDGQKSEERIVEPVNGDDIVLTIDRIIQAQAEKILSETISKNKAESGTVIVQEPSSGKILAMANSPSFDPNNYSKSSVGTFLNPAIQSIYESGSVFKVITMVAGIDSGKITPETKFKDTGVLTLNGKTIRNHDDKVFGTVTMTEVIENSVNTGAAFVVRETGYDNFYSYVTKFGFSDETGIGLPGEVRGNLKSLKIDAKDINFATASFGQGIAVTPIELINAISAIANGGVLMKPYLIASGKPQIVRRVIKADTAGKVMHMMASAVKKAKIAQIPNYQIAGKTGTAQIPDFKKGGYTDEFIHTFAGFAPATEPRFAILFKIDKPQVGPLAGYTVVPAFRELAEFILNYYNIPPDNLSGN